MDIPSIAWAPAISAAPTVVPVPGPVGGFELRVFPPIGGIALIDYFAAAVISGIVIAEPDFEAWSAGEQNSRARQAWRLAIAMLQERPPMPEPPADEQNHRPRLALPR